MLRSFLMLAYRGSKIAIGFALALIPCLVALVLVLEDCRAQSGPTIWIAPSLQRVGPTAAAGSSAAAQIAAGRGETESFQIIVRAPGNGLSNVNVTVTDLTGPGTIAKSNISLYREQYVSVSPGSPNWGGSNQPLGAGVYPDPLIPFTDPSTGKPITGAALEAVPFNVAASNNQSIWVDVFVPRNAAPGQYTGNYTVSSNQGNFTGSISLTVWHFTLPQKPSLESSFSYWTATGLAADSELLRNRLTPLAVPASEQASLMSNYGLTTSEPGFLERSGCGQLHDVGGAVGEYAPKRGEE